MIPKRYTDLVGRLVQRTDGGGVSWKSTADETTFVVNFKQSSLSISSGYDQFHQRSCVYFVILDSEGSAADDFRVSEGEADWGVVHGLYSEARRKARNIDLVIGDMTDQLKSDLSVSEEDINSESDE